MVGVRAAIEMQPLNNHRIRHDVEHIENAVQKRVWELNRFDLLHQLLVKPTQRYKIAIHHTFVAHQLDPSAIGHWNRRAARGDGTPLAGTAS